MCFLTSDNGTITGNGPPISSTVKLRVWVLTFTRNQKYRSCVNLLFTCKHTVKLSRELNLNYFILSPTYIIAIARFGSGVVLDFAIA